MANTVDDGKYHPPELKEGMDDSEKLCVVREATYHALEDYADNNGVKHFNPGGHGDKHSFSIKLPDGTKVEVSFKIHEKS